MTDADTVADTTEAELDALLDAAVAAAPVLAATRPSVRAGWLRAVADALDADAERLIPLAAEESHLAVPRLTGELKRTTFQLRLFADVPWLAPQLVAAVQAYASDISIDTEQIESALQSVDPTDPTAMQSALSDSLFTPEPSAAQRAALGRLLDVTRLREGPAVAAAHIQAAAERVRPGVEVVARPARRSSPAR